MNLRPPQRNFALFLVGAAAVLAYLPGLWGPFFFDDLPNLIFNPFVHLKSLDASSLRDAAVSNQSGLFLRPIASLSFALNYYFAGGFDPFHFKATNLVIHLLNGGLVYLLARGICRRLEAMDAAGGRVPLRDAFPLIVAALWLLHPLQLTSVLYVVQRMNSLAAMFTLAGLLLYMEGRVRLDRGERGALGLMAGGVIGGAFLGVLCKENAALLPVFALILELSCFRSSGLGPPARRRLWIYYAAVLGLPALAVAIYTVIHPEFILSTYEIRTFTLWERVLTQFRVLFYYLALALFPSRQALGLFHDDYQVSAGLLEPVTTLISIIGWIGLVVLAIKLRRRAPVLFLGVGWYLGGHLMESTVFGLEMVHEHRNYLPLFGILFAATYFALQLFRRVSVQPGLTYAIVVLATLTMGFVTSSRAYTWSSMNVLLETLVKRHPESPRAHGAYAAEIIGKQGDIRKAYYHLQQFTRLDHASIVGPAEIVRIAQGLGLSNSPPEAFPENLDPAAPLHEMPLVHNAAYLRILEQSARAELERRLTTYPISANTVKAFVDLQRCLYMGTRVCERLAPDLLRWIELALDNPRNLNVYRAVLRITAAKIYSWQGDLDKAVDYAEQSVELAPQDVNFAIDLVKLHMHLQNYARAREIMDDIKSRPNSLGFRAEELQQLEMRLVAAENAATMEAGS